MKRLIDTLLAADADACLFTSGDERLTAGRIRAAAARVGAELAESRGDIVLHTASAARFVAGLLAIASLGRRAILPANIQPSYLAEIAATDKVLLTDEALPLDAGADAPPGALAGALAAADRNPTLVFFTSGSTGTPKPVERPLAGLDAESNALEALWGADARTVVATVSHQHIYGLLFRVMWPILAGRSSSDAPAAYWEDLDGILGPDVTLISSPAHLTRLPPSFGFREPPLIVVSSGQALPYDAAKASEAAFGRAPIEVLGSTETGGIAWRRQSAPDTPWTAFDAVSVSSADDGAMLVRSRYFESEEPHRTGDGVEFFPDGRFRLRPRLDRVAKIDGKRVSLARVEEKLATLPEIAAAATLVLPKRKQALAAVCQLTPAGQAALAERGAFRLSRDIRAASASMLEPAERPKHWRFLDAIPVNTQGKRVLAMLEALFDDPLDTLTLDIRSQTDDAAEIAFRLPPELIFFRGHFPGRPILPGVAQTHMAVLFAERLWGFRPPSAKLSRVKFRRMLLPEDQIVLKLSHKNRERVIFSYHVGDLEASRGEIG
jgi:acyl-CoA synthetase (AMP-forming)/AMP-acid ligase II